MRSKFAINIFLLTFIFSCNEESIRESPTNLIWAPSDFSEYGASFFSFREGDDNNLYSTGFVNNQFGVHREINGNWEIVLQLEWPKFGVQDFAVFKQVIYLVSEGMLWKASGANVEKVNFGNRITSISQLNEKLIVTGDFSDGANTTSGAAFTEDGSLFTPIAPAEGNFITPGYLILATSSKLFIGSGNFNAYEYDGLNLKKIEFSQWFSNVDTEGNFYTIDHNSDGRRQIVKLKNGVSTKLGSPFGKENIIR